MGKENASIQEQQGLQGSNRSGGGSHALQPKGWGPPLTGKDVVCPTETFTSLLYQWDPRESAFCSATPHNCPGSCQWEGASLSQPWVCREAAQGWCHVPIGRRRDFRTRASSSSALQHPLKLCQLQRQGHGRPDWKAVSCHWQHLDEEEKRDGDTQCIQRYNS